MSVKMLNKPNIPYIMNVMAELLSKQYGCEITITATLKDEYKDKGEANETQPGTDVAEKAHFDPAVQPSVMAAE